MTLNPRQSRKQDISPLKKLVLVTLLLNLLVAGITGYSIYQGRLQAEKQALLDAQGTTLILEQAASSTLDKIDIALHVVAHEARHHGHGSTETQKIIQNTYEKIPETDSLRVTNASGTVIGGSGRDKSRPVSIADREYFAQLRDNPQSGMVISKPIIGRISKKWGLTLARRIDGPDGTFKGVAFSSITLQYFNELFEKSAVGPNGYIVMRDSDLAFITRHPGQPDNQLTQPGNRNAPLHWQQQLSKGLVANGAYHAVSRSTRLPSLFVYSRVGNYPLYIQVVMAETDYLAVWQKSLRTAMLFLALFLLISLLSAWLLYRNWQQNLSAMLLAKEQENRFQALADSGQALIWTSGLDKKCDYFNKTWLEFTGRPLEKELGDGWTEGVHPEDLDHCVSTYVDAFERQEQFSMDYRLLRHDGQYRWLQDDGTPRYDIDGRFIGYIGHCLDITRLKKAEDAVRRLNAELEQRVKERTTELTAKTEELERLNRVFVGRELRMRELKEQLARLEVTSK